MKRSGTVCIQEWDDFFRLANLFSANDWTFRGQKDASWKLTTTIERNKHDRENFYAKLKCNECDDIGEALTKYFSICSKFPDELSAIKEFRHYAIRQGFDFGNNWVEYLATMQHYGAATRLLDFTTSILVALYFAFEESFALTNRAIWAVRLSALEDAIVFNRNEIVHQGIKLPICYEEIASWIIKNPRHARKDLFPKMVLPLRLPGNNDRLVAQNGMFLFPVSRLAFSGNLAASLELGEMQVECPQSIEFTEVENALREKDEMLCLLKIVFDMQMARDARRILNMANITSRTIYPDLDGIAKSINYKYQ